MVVVMKNGRAGRELAIRWLGELTRLSCLALETNVGREQVSEMDGKQLHSFVFDDYCEIVRAVQDGRYNRLERVFLIQSPDYHVYYIITRPTPIPTFPSSVSHDLPLLAHLVQALLRTILRLLANLRVLDSPGNPSVRESEKRNGVGRHTPSIHRPHCWGSFRRRWRCRCRRRYTLGRGHPSSAAWIRRRCLNLSAILRVGESGRRWGKKSVR